MTSLARAIRSVLEAPDPRDKVRRARAVARDWQRGRLTYEFDVAMPDRPARPTRPELLPPAHMPARRRAGSRAGRIAMLHAFAHIEFSAIDLAFDMAGRFGAAYPRAFIDDWLSVGADEALHFLLLERRLAAFGSHYGALPAHDGLWESAAATSADVLARLAIVPMVLEARGLDVSPATIARLAAMGDQRSAQILERIYTDEIRHVGFGSKWFGQIAESLGEPPAQLWRTLVKRHFRGQLKPPFNDSARLRAGLTREFYDELAPGTGIDHAP
ncbi:MAG: ferritin-like domain-containing protein [Chakrabartia sp.]